MRRVPGEEAHYYTSDSQADAGGDGNHRYHALSGVIESLGRKGRVEAHFTGELGSQDEPEGLSEAPGEVGLHMEGRYLAQKRKNFSPAAQQDIHGVDRHPDRANGEMGQKQAPAASEETVPETAPPAAYGLHIPGKQGKSGKKQENPADGIEPVHENSGA